MAIASESRDAAGDRWPAVVGGTEGTVSSLPPAARGHSSPPPGEWTCPECGRTQDGRFCERCGYDSHLPPDEPDEEEDEVGGVFPSARPAQPVEWIAVASADRKYYQHVRRIGGDGVASIKFPPFYPERRFRLRGEQMLIGRYSSRRGTEPDIDLTGPPEDLALGRSHALLVAQPDGSWSIVDLESINQTYLNDYTAQPLEPHVPVPLGDGDRIYLGAWTVLTIRVRSGG